MTNLFSRKFRSGSRQIVTASASSEFAQLGEVVEVTIEQTYSGSRAEIKAVSNSSKIDEKIERRIFQNPDKKFCDILNVSRLNISDCKISLDEKISAQKCTEIILQHEETNFKFIKRIAA